MAKGSSDLGGRTGNTWAGRGNHRHARRFREIGKAESEARVVVLPFLRIGASPGHGKSSGKDNTKQDAKTHMACTDAT